MMMSQTPVEIIISGGWLKRVFTLSGREGHVIGIYAVVKKFKHMLKLLSKVCIITADSSKNMKLGVRNRVLTAGRMVRRVTEVKDFVLSFPR